MLPAELALDGLKSARPNTASRFQRPVKGHCHRCRLSGQAGRWSSWSSLLLRHHRLPLRHSLEPLHSWEAPIRSNLTGNSRLVLSDFLQEEDHMAAVITKCLQAYSLSDTHRWSELKRMCPLCSGEFRCYPASASDTEFSGKRSFPQFVRMKKAVILVADCIARSVAGILPAPLLSRWSMLSCHGDSFRLSIEEKFTRKIISLRSERWNFHYILMIECQNEQPWQTYWLKG